MAKLDRQPHNFLNNNQGINIDEDRWSGDLDRRKENIASLNQYRRTSDTIRMIDGEKTVLTSAIL